MWSGPIPTEDQFPLEPEHPPPLQRRRAGQRRVRHRQSPPATERQQRARHAAERVFRHYRHAGRSQPGASSRPAKIFSLSAPSGSSASPAAARFNGGRSAGCPAGVWWATTSATGPRSSSIRPVRPAFGTTALGTKADTGPSSRPTRSTGLTANFRVMSNLFFHAPRSVASCTATCSSRTRPSGAPHVRQQGHRRRGDPHRQPGTTTTTVRIGAFAEQSSTIRTASS